VVILFSLNTDLDSDPRRILFVADVTCFIVYKLIFLLCILVLIKCKVVRLMEDFFFLKLSIEDFLLKQTLLLHFAALNQQYFTVLYLLEVVYQARIIYIHMRCSLDKLEWQ